MMLGWAWSWVPGNLIIASSDSSLLTRSVIRLILFSTWLIAWSPWFSSWFRMSLVKISQVTNNCYRQVRQKRTNRKHVRAFMISFDIGFDCAHGEGQRPLCHHFSLHCHWGLISRWECLWAVPAGPMLTSLARLCCAVMWCRGVGIKLALSSYVHTECCSIVRRYWLESHQRCIAIALFHQLWELFPTFSVVGLVIVTHTFLIFYHFSTLFLFSCVTIRQTQASK